MKNILKFGATYSILTYSALNKNIETGNNDFTVYVDETGQTSQFQSFLQWKHKFSDKITLISGLHFIYFLLNIYDELIDEFKAPIIVSFFAGSAPYCNPLPILFSF